MNVVIVHAHEEPKSFNGALKETAVRVLKEAGHTVEVSDLYAMKFNPVGGKHDFTTLADPDFFKDFQRTGDHSRDGALTLEVLLQQITAHVPHRVRFIEEKRRAMA